MFKLFQEVCDSGLQRSRLILSVGGREFVADEVPEQAEVGSFFFRRLKIFCPHVLAHRWGARNQESSWARNYHAD
jgi:hypothetical protein